MKSKRGQITIFIIVGIVILVVTALAIYLTRETTPPTEQELDYTPTNVQFFIESCLHSTSNKIIRTVALQGGYYKVPQGNLYLYNYPSDYYDEESELEFEDNPESVLNPQLLEQVAIKNDLVDYNILTEVTLPEFYIPTAYGLKENKLLFKDLDFVMEEISQGIETEILECLNYFEPFDYLDITTNKPPKADVTINDRYVVVNLNYQVIVDGSEMNLFNDELPLPYGKLHSIALELLNKQINNDWLDLDFLQEQEAEIQILNIDHDNYAFLISEETMTLVAAVKMIRNLPPFFFINNTIQLHQFEPFQLEIEAISDDEYEFYDDSILFSINPHGFINFTPLIFGNFTVTITMVDSAAQEDVQFVNFTILEGVYE